MKPASPTAQAARGPGRPREFDFELVLDRAIDVFRQRGYHATSLNDLADGMGLARGSVYKAFKDKRSLFLAAHQRYAVVRSERLQAALRGTANGREGIRAVFRVYAAAASSEDGRLGCLVLATAAELTTLDPGIAAQVAAGFERIRKTLLQLLRQGRRDGSINPALDERAAAHFLLCLLQGMRMVGKAAPNPAAMSRTAAAAMKALD